MPRSSFPVLLATLLFAGSLEAEPSPTPPSAAKTAVPAAVTVSIGGREVALPSPADFIRLDGANPELDKGLTQTIPASNRLVAFFGLKGEWDLTLAGMPSAITRTMNGQVVKQLENREIGTRSFGEIKRVMRAEVVNIEKATLKAVNELKSQGRLQVGSEGALDFTNIAFLGYTLDDETSFGYTLAFKVNVQQGTAAAETRMIASMALITANGRHLMLYANAPYVDEDSRKWCEQAVAAWARQVVAANPRIEGPSTEINFGRAAWVGAITGGLAVVAFALLRKRPSGSA